MSVDFILVECYCKDECFLDSLTLDLDYSVRHMNLICLLDLDSRIVSVPIMLIFLLM